MIKWIIIIIVVILLLNKGNNVEGNDSHTNIKTAENANVNRCSIAVDSPEPFYSILSSLEMATDSVIHGSYCDVRVVVQVRKIDSTYCRVSLNLIADTVFRDVEFGEGFHVSGNDQACFETCLATGFTSPEAVRQEILLQFNWPDISVSDTQITILDHGDYDKTPYVCYSFTAKKQNQL